MKLHVYFHTVWLLAGPVTALAILFGHSAVTLRRNVRLRRAVDAMPEPATIQSNRMHYLGDNSFHHHAIPLVTNLHRDFTLVLIDRHSDIRARTNALDCGSWIGCALEHAPVKKAVWLGGITGTGRRLADPYLNAVALMDRRYLVLPYCASSVYVKGVDPAAAQVLDGFDLQDAASDTIAAIFGMPGATLTFPSYRMAVSQDELGKLLGSEPIYISIDLDVLEVDACGPTIWGNGLMTWSELISLLRYLTARCDVLGIDVCGPVKGWRMLLDEKIR